MYFVSPSGKVTSLYADAGKSVLDVAHANGIDIEGACEGAMACSTCHVVVDSQWYERLPEPSEEEQDMLDLTNGLTRTSRLGCQLRLDQSLDGLVVHLPLETHNMLD
ncbi:MAG: 2Fe-2S iron-sulfur cluster-binding protein [Rhodospirillaceae bacterium]|nr:2Fe-2S iron-sulfur cluster-binding protein [Rhodospirillaceae bacterium]